MKYLPISSISVKLSKAARKGEVLYIQGEIGIGKTMAVRHYLKRKKAVWFEGEQGFLKDMPGEFPAGIDAIVFDDVSCIRDFRSKEFILKMIRQRVCQIILIGRGDLPDWLAVISTQVPFRFASRLDFLLDRNELEKALVKERDNLEEETADRILRRAFDNPLFFAILSSRVVEGVLTDENFDKARISYFHIMDERFFDRLDREEQLLMVALSSFDRFSLEMARRISSIAHIEKVFERLFQLDACLVRRGDHYEITEPYQSYLRWKQSLVFDHYKRAGILRRAAAYYVEMGDMFTAVDYFHKARDADLVRDTVIRICEDTDMVIKNLNRIIPCLDMLTVEQSLNEPLIMMTRSLAYSLQMNRDRSEVWYERLAEYADQPDLGRSGRIETTFYLAYLDLILPHRSTTRWLDRLQRYLEAKKRWNGRMRIPSVTLYGHSVLNGLFDFSHMIMEKGLLEKLMAAVRQDKGAMREETTAVIKLLIQEVALEREEVDETVFVTQINRIILDGERKDYNDICVTAIVQYAKLKLMQGDTAGTEKIHTELAYRIKKAPLLFRVIQSINAWIGLLKGEIKPAEEWFLQTPDNREFFSLLNKNDFILKARIYMVKREYQDAHILLTRLCDVYADFNRDYLWILAELLMAILFYRMNSPRWLDCFTEALKKAEEFRYIRVIADEGAAVLPLFGHMPVKNKKAFDKGWYDHVEASVRDMARHYPHYLEEKRPMGVSLTRAEKRVMNSICRGMSSEEICGQLHISYSGLKYHKRNIYRKMGVHTMEEAISIARTMDLDKE